MEYAVTVYQNFIFPLGGSIWSLIVVVIAGDVMEWWAVSQIIYASRVTEAGLESAKRHMDCYNFWHCLMPSRQKLVEVQLKRFIVRQLCECFAPVHFAIIFSFDVFLWNKQDMYNIRDVTSFQAYAVLQKLAVAAFFRFFFAALHLRMLSKHLAAVHRRFLNDVLRKCHTDWLWLLVCTTGSVSTICGACMIMKHDGMDLGLEFKWLHPEHQHS
eukprot:TRINITY_DN10298_c0_g1_i2.p2 TRINITY_DN10298_c0_g1~~TRINITY_DN10298_c0_g1_i2.p2  ORF type:complete len:214 (+),score=50.65 TRINITY_DN10298_c0_g1_i2:143-784(+)